MTINASGQVLMGGSTPGQSIAYELALSPTASINLNQADVRRLANKTTAGTIVSMGDVRGQGARQSYTPYASGSSTIAQVTAGITATPSSRLGVSWGLTYVETSTSSNSLQINLWSSSALSTADWASKWKIIRTSDNALMKNYTASGSASTWFSQTTTTDPYYGAGWIQSISFNTSVSAFAAGVEYAIVFN